MALQPIEMQVLMLKTTEVSRIQQQRDALPQNNQQMLSNEELKKVAIKQEQVQTMEQLNNQKIKRDNEAKDKRNLHKEKQEAKADDADNTEEEESLDPIRGHKLDLKL